MKRERIRARVDRTVDGLSARVDDNVLRLTDRTRGWREPAVEWDGWRSFLAALPRLWTPRARGRVTTAHGIGTDRARATHGDDAA
jgi:hypothetical protein